MERNNLICSLFGWYSAKIPNIKGEDLKIMIDNSLMESHLTPLGKEDNQLLDELLGEIMISVMGKGINRETRRKYGVIKSK